MCLEGWVGCDYFLFVEMLVLVFVDGEVFVCVLYLLMDLINCVWMSDVL